MCFEDNLYNLQESFDFYGIDTSKPGFYNDINFIKAEKENPNFLNLYATYINDKEFSNEYLARAERVTKIIAQILYEELKKANKKGCCIDISLIFSKMLEKENIWNYTIKGALSIEGKRGSNLEGSNAYFYIRDVKPAAGHVWLCVPPFKIVDLTLKEQNYENKQIKFIEYLPKILMNKKINYCEASISKIYSPEYRYYYEINQIPENLVEFQKEFKPFDIEYSNYVVSYLPCGITASDGSLEENTSIYLNGLNGISIYNQLVKPALK